MNRLMRAEWYRVRTTYHLAAWTVIFCIFITYIGYMDIGMDSTVTGMDALNLFMEHGMLFVLYLPLLVGGMYVTSYENKILSYEVMAGNKPSIILLSKLLTVVPVISAIAFALLISPVIFFGSRNGYGDTQYLAVKVILLAVTCVRVVVCALLIMTTFQSVIGMFAVFVRFILLEGVGLIVVEILKEWNKAFDNLIFFFAGSAMNCVAMPEIPNKYLILCVVFSVVEMLIWYVLSYNSYKKRWFN